MKLALKGKRANMSLEKSRNRIAYVGKFSFEMAVADLKFDLKFDLNWKILVGIFIKKNCSASKLSF